jgi:hypothetical protein
MRPTALAATPDMGLIVHSLGDKRAIPIGEWRHVEINEAAIDWQSGGQNYADVVSKAVDEAGGHAFATDYAGDTSALEGRVGRLGEAILERVRGAELPLDVLQIFAGSQDADVIRVLDAELDLPEDINAATFLSCLECFRNELPDGAIDGNKIADRMEREIEEPRNQLAKFLGAKYLTRMFTTMSPSEMTADPSFDFNGDLPEVLRTRTADGFLDCDFNMYKIVTSTGLVVRLENGGNPAVIRREAGETVAGADIRAAAVVARMPLTGAPEVIEDNRRELEETFREQDDVGCDCQSVASSTRPSGALGWVLRTVGARR